MTLTDTRPVDIVAVPLTAEVPRRQLRLANDLDSAPAVALRAIELAQAKAYKTAPAELATLARQLDTRNQGLNPLGLGRAWLLGRLDVRGDDLTLLCALGLVSRASAAGW